MEGYTLKPGDEGKIDSHVLVVEADGVAREIDRSELDSVLAKNPAMVDMRRVGFCHASGRQLASMAALAQLRMAASQVSFDAEPPKPKTPKLPVIEMPREPLKARRKQLLKILRERNAK